MYNYDFCDFMMIAASNPSASTMTHVLSEYGGGDMGKGIIRTAGEALMIGRQQGYGLGYDDGVVDAYPIAYKHGYKNGVITALIIETCAAGLIIAGICCTKKLIERHNLKKEEKQLLSDSTEEVSENA